MENGLCVKIILPVSSSSSYIGKSTMKHNSNRLSSIMFMRFATSVRICPANFGAFFLVSAMK